MRIKFAKLTAVRLWDVKLVDEYEVWIFLLLFLHDCGLRVGRCLAALAGIAQRRAGPINVTKILTFSIRQQLKHDPHLFCPLPPDGCLELPLEFSST